MPGDLLPQPLIKGTDRSRSGVAHAVFSALVSRIGIAQRDVQISTIFKLAKAFDLTPGQFIDGDLQ